LLTARRVLKQLGPLFFIRHTQQLLTDFGLGHFLCKVASIPVEDSINPIWCETGAQGPFDVLDDIGTGLLGA